MSSEVAEGGGALPSVPVLRRHVIDLTWVQKAQIVEEIRDGVRIYDVALREGIKQATIRTWQREYRLTRGVGYAMFGRDFYYALVSGPGARKHFFDRYGVSVDEVIARRTEGEKQSVLFESEVSHA